MRRFSVMISHFMLWKLSCILHNSLLIGNILYIIFAGLLGNDKFLRFIYILSFLSTLLQHGFANFIPWKCLNLQVQFWWIIALFILFTHYLLLHLPISRTTAWKRQSGTQTLQNLLSVGLWWKISPPLLYNYFLVCIYHTFFPFWSMKNYVPWTKYKLLVYFCIWPLS